MLMPSLDEFIFTSKITFFLVVVKALKDMPALDTDTVFFREDRKPLGRVNVGLC